jgi:hypothetical protein
MKKYIFSRDTIVNYLTTYTEEDDELKFYKRFINNIKVCMYLINKKTYEIHTITKNETIISILAAWTRQSFTAQGIYNTLEHKYHLNNSINNSINKLKKFPDETASNMYQMRGIVNSTYRIYYTTSTFQQDESGIPSIATIASIPINNILGVKDTLNDYQRFLNKVTSEKKLSIYTYRQKATLTLRGLDFTRSEIASQLNLSEYTIEDYKRAFSKKLKC